MKNIRTNCYQCPDRHLGCHSECEVYKEFSAENQRIKDLKYNTEYEKYTLAKLKEEDKTRLRVGKKGIKKMWNTANC